MFFVEGVNSEGRSKASRIPQDSFKKAYVGVVLESNMSYNIQTLFEN